MPVRIIASTLGLLCAVDLVLSAPIEAAPRTSTQSPKKGAKPAHGALGKRASARVAHGRGGKKVVTKVAAVERRVLPLRSGLPNVQALGALVLDENGHELYARNADAERPIASISKLAATLTVMDHGLELEGLSTITKVDIEVARGGARSRLLEGTTLSNRDLLHAALMGSDNRAIPALGRAVKLTPSQLAAAMTAKAKELGLTHTRFHDPTGLSVENVSTPRETIAMLQAVMHHPILGPITRRVEYDAHPVGRPPITYVNTYRPAIRGNVEVLGGKTGYNDDARYCLVLAAKVEGKTCFMAFLSNEGKMTRFGDVARVADWIIARRPRMPPPAPSTVLAGATTVSPAGTVTDSDVETPTTPVTPPAFQPPTPWILTPSRAGAMRTSSVPSPVPSSLPSPPSPPPANPDAPAGAAASTPSGGTPEAAPLSAAVSPP